MSDHSNEAKRILTANEKVLFGIFGHVDGSGYFPPHQILNEFLSQGSDPCDQDGRMGPWTPFVMSLEEYTEVKEWWIAAHPGTVEDNLGVECWDDWIYLLLHGDETDG